MRRYARIAFFLLLLSIPIQLGKHFWPEFSFVQGIRVDYLSPTLYISDLFFVLLFLLSFYKLKARLFSLFKSQPGMILITTLLVSTLLAVNRDAAFFGILKLMEFIYIAVYVSEEYQKKDIEPSLFIVTIGALVETVILVFQFFSQHSLGGLFYFLGERTFNPATPGIAKLQFLGNELLRPYGTFPHPNVLAFYLLFVCAWLLSSLTNKKNLLLYLKLGVISLLSLGIFLTFSRIVILLWIIIVVTYSYKKTAQFSKKTKVKIFSVLFSGIFILGVLFFQRFETSLIKDIMLRNDLVLLSLRIIFAHLLFGVGINNFFYNEILLQKTVSPILLQPVHNIYLLWLCQVGLFGLIPFYYCVKKPILTGISLFRSQNYKNKFYEFAVVIFFCVLIAGFFDHYFFTLQQGQLMTALIIGFCYSKIKDHPTGVV